jgi:hypothetical protein
MIAMISLVIKEVRGTKLILTAEESCAPTSNNNSQIDILRCWLRAENIPLSIECARACWAGNGVPKKFDLIKQGYSQKEF